MNFVFAARKMADWFLDCLTLLARFRDQAYFDMTDEELIDALDGFDPEFAATIYRLLGKV